MKRTIEERTRRASLARVPACVDCGEPATTWRDFGQGIAACSACEAKRRAAPICADCQSAGREVGSQYCFSSVCVAYRAGGAK